MSTYQVRLPEELSLEQLARRTARACAEALRSKGWSCAPEAALAAVKHVFERHLGAFDACGCSSICDEQASPSRWNPSPDSRLLSTTPADRDAVKRYHLRIPRGGLDDLAASSARYLAHACRQGSLPHASEAELAAALAFRQSLGPYTFDSELCRHTELCRLAQPVDLWQAGV